MIRSLWDQLWPNVIAPSAWTILAVVVSHVRARRQRERHHAELTAHVTATAGGIPAGEQQHPASCPACGGQVPADKAGKLAVHSSNGVTCVASGWTIRENR